MNTSKFRVGISTYAWGINGNLQGLYQFLKLANLFNTVVHVLPCYGDREELDRDGGFSTTNHFVIHPKNGTWKDISTISQKNPVLLDIIICHIDEKSVEWQDFLTKGSKSQYADMFLTTDKIYPSGIVPGEELPKFNFFGNPIRGLFEETVGDGEKIVRVQTFLSYQRDFDSNSPMVRKYIENLLILWKSKGVQYCRFDAINTAIKEPGNYPDFYMTPGTYKYIEVLCELAAKHGITPLLELLIAEDDFERLPQNCMLYDFEYQKLIPNILLNKDFSKLVKWLEIIKSKKGKRTILNILSNHDGFCWESKFGLFANKELQSLKQSVESRLDSEDLAASGFEANNIANNTNTSVYNLCQKNSKQWLFANMLFLFLPEGVPLFYYHDLLCGGNDYEAFEKTNEGRYLMRSKFDSAYLSNVQTSEESEFKSIRTLLEFINLKNKNDIFDGSYTIDQYPDQPSIIKFSWGRENKFFSIKFDASDYYWEVHTNL